MFKKICLVLLGMSIAFNADAVDVKKLPAPDKTGVLMETFNKRVSARDYSSKEIGLQTLSDLLWSAFGVNEKGTRTIPTARNEQNLKVYVLFENAVWMYKAEQNELEKVVENGNDLMPYIAKQDFVKDAPVNLIFTGSDEDYSSFHAGAAAQNVYLYATSKGLNTIVRGYIDKDELKNKLHLSRDEFVIINQVIGYPKG
ncbi:MAG: nitroreductase family protein [Alphaproteobacteria bacterium]|nr:nitroreductase family protein [Alphaproteobacteria bacterium]